MDEKGMKIVCFRCPKYLDEALTDLEMMLGKERSKIIREAVEEYIRRYRVNGGELNAKRS